MLGALNSRMKDDFDLWALSRLYRFQGRTLLKAIKATYSRRNTTIDSRPAGLADEFAGEKAARDGQRGGGGRAEASRHVAD